MNTPNAFADLFHTAVLGSDEPDVANIPCHISGSFMRGAQLDYERQFNAVLEMPLGFGLRDAYNAGEQVLLQLGPDEIYAVLFVERDRKLASRNFLRAYLVKESSPLL
jgi:hypothetical protein